MPGRKEARQREAIRGIDKTSDFLNAMNFRFLGIHYSSLTKALDNKLEQLIVAQRKEESNAFESRF